jgi:transposase-like protein
VETGKTRGMKPPPDPYRGHRFPASLRDVEPLLAKRGIVVSYETVWRWSKNFGESFANRLRRPGHNRGTNGTWTRCSSGSRAHWCCHFDLL